MNFIERKLAKLAWKRLEARMGSLKRWMPLIGSGVVVVATVARYAGYPEVAQAIDVVGSLTGATSASGVSPTEVLAAVTAGLGVGLKLWSLAKKALGGHDEYVSPR